jgi:hypothetical protein
MIAFVYVLRGLMGNAKITDRVLLRCAHNTYLAPDWLDRLSPRPVALTGSNMLHTKHPVLIFHLLFQTCVQIMIMTCSCM